MINDLSTRHSKALVFQRKPIHLHGTNGLEYTHLDKAETFENCLERECRENKYRNKKESRRGVRKIWRKDEVDRIDQTTSEEAREIINSLKEMKAPCQVGISSQILKRYTRKAIGYITNIINAILRLKHILERWKEANAIMRPKPNNSLVFPQNYKPISLLPTTALSKVAERVTVPRINE